MTVRTVKQIHPALRDDIRDLKTSRPLPGPRLPHLNPFLFLNHHGPQVYPAGNGGLPFGPHPHRGFETVTFMIRGSLAHYDSGGHESVIDAGGIQWMTAGSGLIHAELSPEAFKQQGGELEILQLWLNLPSALKMTKPKYTGLQKDQLPLLKTPDGKGHVQLVSGHYAHTDGPVQSLTETFIAVVHLDQGGSVEFDQLDGRVVFVYVVSGSISIDGTAIEAFNLVELGTSGQRLEIFAQRNSIVLFGHASPVLEPIAMEGPFVMNTRDELIQAFSDYRAGLFDAPLA